MAGTYGLHGHVTLTAAATTYLFGIVSGSATSDGVLARLDITMDGSALAAGVLFELFRATGGPPSTTAFTPASGASVLDLVTSDSRTNTGWASAWIPPITVSPTGLAVIDNWYYDPVAGALRDEPLGREWYLPAGTTNWYGLRATAGTGVSPNCGFVVRQAE